MNQEEKVRLVYSLCQDVDYVDLIAEKYVEPGYDNPETLIVTGNWNYDKEVDTTEIFPEEEEKSDTLYNVLEKLGCSCEWSDEWAMCEECQGAFRTSPDSYSWKRSYAEIDGYLRCHECICKDPEEYVESMIGKADHAITFDVDLESLGFVKYKGDYESGWHPGQTDDPKNIAKKLESRGIERYVFVIDQTGQFDINFSVWVDEKQLFKSQVLCGKE